MSPLTVGLIIADQQLWQETQSCLRDLPVRVVLHQAAVPDLAGFLAQLERFSPEALLLDITGAAKTFEETIGRIRALPNAPSVVALNTTADPETILAAVRAGASEYLYPPLQPGLARALERISAGRAKTDARRRRSAKIAAFVSAKGGCGATTIACHVAAEMQRSTAHEILLADFDLDSGIIGFLMKASNPYSLLDAVKNLHRLDLSYWKALISNGTPRLEIIPAPPAGALNGYVEPDLFRQVLSLVRGAYDWIVADLGRNVGSLALALMEELDEVFVISTLDLPALHQARQVTRCLLERGFGQSRMHLILNRMPKRSDFTPEEVQRIIGLDVYATLPNSYPELFEAYAHGTLLPGNTELGQQLSKLTQRICGAEAPRSRN